MFLIKVEFKNGTHQIISATHTGELEKVVKDAKRMSDVKSITTYKIHQIVK